MAGADFDPIEPDAGGSDLPIPRKRREDETFEDLYKRRTTGLEPPFEAGSVLERYDQPMNWYDRDPFNPRPGLLENRTRDPVLFGEPGHALFGSALQEAGERMHPRPMGRVPSVHEAPSPMALAAGAGAVDKAFAEERAKGTVGHTYMFKKDYPTDTELTPDEMQAYRKWAIGTGRLPENEEQDYDLRGYWKDVIHGNPRLPPEMQDKVNAIRAENAAKGTDHLTDLYKKPSHPTFSDQSIYHGPLMSGIQKEEGGHWDVGNKTFTPGPTNLAHHSKKFLKEYFDKYGEPGYTIRFPPGVE